MNYLFHDAKAVLFYEILNLWMTHYRYIFLAAKAFSLRFYKFGQWGLFLVLGYISTKKCEDVQHHSIIDVITMIIRSTACVAGRLITAVMLSLNCILETRRSCLVSVESGRSAPSRGNTSTA